jgi:hypothetical protein
VSAVRDGWREDAIFQLDGGVPADEVVAGRCHFCGELVQRGSHWAGHRGELWVCADCIRDGVLGLLVGDAFDGFDALHEALIATLTEAWRARRERLERRAAG